jgi:hypothetical protein
MVCWRSAGKLRAEAKPERTWASWTRTGYQQLTGALYAYRDSYVEPDEVVIKIHAWTRE